MIAGRNRIRRFGAVTFLGVACSTLLFAQAVRARVEGDRLRITAVPVHFLGGSALTRLHSGAAVTYRLRLKVVAERGGKELARAEERFTFSYDLWEEKFAVTRAGVPTRSASNLTAAKAEAWCLDNLTIAAAEVPADRQFWLRLEYETEEPRDSTASEGVTLAGLIDVFSRRPKDDRQVRDAVEDGPYTLQALRKN